MAGHRGDGVGDDDAIEVNLGVFEESIVTPSPAIPKPPRTANRIHPNPPLKETPHVRAKGTPATISKPVQGQGSSGSLPPSNQLPARLHRGYLCRRPIRKVAALRDQLARVFFQKAPGLLANSGSRLAWGAWTERACEREAAGSGFAEGSLVLVASECRVAGSQRCGGMY